MEPIRVTDNCITVKDSYRVSKKDFDEYFDYVSVMYPENLVIRNRTRRALKREWAIHNLLYNIGLFKSHTCDVDLNYPQKKFYSILYAISGAIALTIIR